MRLLTYFTAIACTLSFVGSEAVPGAYFVQLSNDADSFELTPDTLIDRAAQLSIPIQLRHQFHDKTIFHGASVVLADDKHVDKLRALPGVVSVFPVQQLKVNRPTTPGTARSTHDQAATTAIRHEPRDGASRQKFSSVDWNSPHAMTGVDRVHAEGILGEGVRVAILDTGVDYLNPALGGCFGDGCKIGFGYDYVGDEYGTIDFVLRPKPDPRPLCPEAFHGTHVSGIVGMEVPLNASSEFAGLVGVAPRATLGMYRVIACVDIVAGDDVVLAALQRAAEDGADVVSMSFEVLAWRQGRYSPLPAAVSALKAKGIAVFASAGNYGARGMFDIVLPGGSDDAVGVASVENSKFPTYAARDSDGNVFLYGALHPFAEGEYPVAWAGNDTNTRRSGCSAFDYPPASSLSGPISDYIVAVKRGVDCTLEQIQYLATAAAYSKIVTYIDSTDRESTRAYGVPSSVLDAQGFEVSFASTVGDKLSQAEKTSSSYKIFIHSRRPLLEDQFGGSSPNNFSSVGPDTDFGFKPNMAAPGGSILATFPVFQNSSGFGILSGTSMSTPYAAGVYALIKSQHPHLSVDEILDRMRSTAKPTTMVNSDQLAPAVQQGAGLIQAYDAIHATTHVQPTEFTLVKSWETYFSINNPSDRDLTYTLSTRPASGVSAFARGAPRSDSPGFYPQDLAAKIEFIDGAKVIVPAGGSKNVSFLTTPPSINEPNLVPILSGFIDIESSLGEHLTVSYMGPAYNYSSATVVGLKNLTDEQKADARIPGRDPLSAPQVFANSNGADIGNRRAFSLRWPDVIIARFSSLQPVRQYRMDIIRASTNFTPTWYGFDPRVKQGNLTETPIAENGTIGGVPIIGSIDIQNDFPPRTAYEVTWSSYPLDVTGAIGIDLRKGSYRILMRWLKYFEDEENPESWDSWLSGVIDITEDQIRVP